MDIQSELSRIQRELHVPKLRDNKFGGYKFRNAEDIMNAVKKMLVDDMSLIVSDDVVEIGGWHYVKSTAQLWYKNEKCSAIGLARESEIKKGMDAAQITGAASSYARKTAMCGLFAIDDGIDADATNTHGKSAAMPRSGGGGGSGKISDAQMRKLQYEVGSRKITPMVIKQIIKDIAGVESSKDIPKNKFNEILEAIDGK